MPYISKHDRPQLDAGKIDPRNTGELNYKITKLLIDYTEQFGVSYKTINDVLGAMTGAGQEFYRRIAAPYEDIKIQEHTDVYPRHLLKP